MLEEQLNLITQYFYEEHEYDPITIELVITGDIYSKRLELAIDEMDKIAVLKNKAFIETLNGTVVLPKSFDASPTIILNEDAIKDDLAYLETIVHEMTHLFDYRDLAKHIGASTYTELQGYEYQAAFYYWTEFHARRCGYQFYGKLLWQDDYKSQERLVHVRDTESQFQMNYLVKMLGQYVNDGVQYMYSFMQYMGRYSVWQDLFPSTFNDLPTNLKYEYNGVLSKIYARLCEWNEFKLVKFHFGELQGLFNEIR